MLLELVAKNTVVEAAWTIVYDVAANAARAELVHVSTTAL
jgi:hypothetical protein